jgi:DNA-binding GntR family transcriptional regulator
MPAATQPLKPSTLREQAWAALRASIITGELVSGQLYSVASVAERLQVSATPIREALSDLAHNGLVTVVRNRGFYVPELTEHDLDEIFELRMMLEVPAVARLAGNVPPEVLKDCRYQVERSVEAASAGDLPTFLDADRDFHLHLIAALGNARLVETLDTLRDQARLYGLSHMTATGELAASAQEHERLLTAVEAGDADAAAEQMRLHLKHTRGVWADRPET